MAEGLNFVTPSQSILKNRKKRAAAELAAKLVKVSSEQLANASDYHARKKKRDEMIEKALLAMSTVQGSYLEAEKNVPKSYVNRSSRQCASDLYKREFIPISCDDLSSRESQVQSPRGHSLSYSRSSSPLSGCKIEPIATTNVCPSFVYSRQYADNRARYWRKLPNTDDGQQKQQLSADTECTTSSHIKSSVNTRIPITDINIAPKEDSSWWNSVQFFQQEEPFSDCYLPPTATAHDSKTASISHPNDESTILNDSTLSLEDSVLHREESHSCGVQGKRTMDQSDKEVQVGTGVIRVVQRHVRNRKVQTEAISGYDEQQRKAESYLLLSLLLYVASVVGSTVSVVLELFEDRKEQKRRLVPITHSLNNL